MFGLRWEILWLVLAALPAASGCVVPLSLSERSAEGTNTRPRIIAENTTPALGKLTVSQSPVGGTPITTIFSVVVDDPDPQTLHGRLFLNRAYGSAVFGGETQAPYVDFSIRALIFRISGLCDDMVQFDPGPHLLEIYVSDAPFVSSGSDRRVPTDDGAVVNDSWQISCSPYVAGDGGI